MMQYCQNAANEAMIKVCGDTENCNGLAVDDGIGARSLEYKICEKTGDKTCYTNVAQIPDSKLGRATGEGENQKNYTAIFTPQIYGRIAWDVLDFDDNGQITDENIAKAISASDKSNKEIENKINSELKVLQNSINAAINTIEADPTVIYCKTGRTVQGMKKLDDADENGQRMLSSKRKDFGGTGNDFARFPQLTQQTNQLIAVAAVAAAKNNYAKKYDEMEKDIANDMIALAERNAKALGENQLDARREAARQSCVNYAANASLDKNTQEWDSTENKLVGSSSVNERSYKETVTSTFNWETLICHRCTRKQACAKMKGKNCRTWGEVTESCTDIQF
ncbi:hypothetical protein HDR61_04280 [bacterium]|nr:hypothetical protein [bacterium]